jgi:hypothetical protein
MESLTPLPRALHRWLVASHLATWLIPVLPEAVKSPPA